MFFIPTFLVQPRSTKPRVSQVFEIDEGEHCHKCGSEEFQLICVKCGTVQKVDELEEMEGEPLHWIVKLALVLVFIMLLFMIVWLFGWAIKCDVYPEYKGTFVQYVNELVDGFLAMLKRLW